MGMDAQKRLRQTGRAMDKAHGDFYFRNRRWLLVLLFLIAWVFLPFSRVSTGQRIAGFLFRVVGGGNLELWERVCYGFAAALIGLGAFWRTWGSAYLGASVVQDRRLHAERLVADGPYRRTRNPLYFGNLLFALGLAAVVNPVTGAIFVIGMWVLVRLFIRDEERGFKESRGEAYRAYRAAVPRLLPAWRPHIPPGDAQPRWVLGFFGESAMWMVAVLTVGFAARLDLKWYAHALPWGIIVCIPLFLWAKRRTRAVRPGTS